jgi:type III secretion protein U
MTRARTEPPTPRRLREARQRGDVARSAELSGAAALAGGIAGLALGGPGIVEALAHAVRAASAGAATAPLDAAGRLSDALGLVLRLSLRVAVPAAAAAALAAALQTGFALFPDVLRPRLERLDPVRGLRRLCSGAQLARAALGLSKALALLLILAGWWVDAARPLASLPRAAGVAAAPGALALLAPLAFRLAAALALIGLLDHALERRRLRRALMMTRDDVLREVREDEGDPGRRAERRRVHRALVEAGAIARATVVVVNPTRLAVALRHDRGGPEAPRVIAKGQGRAAARIRSAARQAGVPILRDVPLARALHRLAEVGDEIPEELYDAAAALLAHLYAPAEAP